MKWKNKKKKRIKGQRLDLAVKTLVEMSTAHSEW